MNNRMFLFCLTIFSLLFCGLDLKAQKDVRRNNLPVMVAHRGCHNSLIPENSVSGVSMAKRYGYKIIECDPRYTSDGVLVLLHDETINRTMRRAADYAEIKEPLKLSDLKFADLRRDYVLASDDPAERKPIPTYEEFLQVCRKEGIMPMVHSNIIEAYEMTQRVLGDGWICFTVDEPALLKAREMSNCLILLAIDEAKYTPAEAVEKLKQIGGRGGVSTMNYNLLDAAYCQAMREAGFEAQASIFPTPHEVEGLRNDISFQLSDFCLAPDRSFKPKETLKRKNIRLQDADRYDHVWNNPYEFGGITVEIRFVGTIEVELNGRSYILTRETLGSDYLSTRFVRSAPELHIKGKGSAILKQIDARVYSF